MRAILRAMPTMLSVHSALMLQYRGEIILWAVWGVVYPAVSMAMWQAAGGGRPLAGYGPGDISAYFLLTMVVGHVTTAWDIYEFGYFIRSGRLSDALLRPMMPLWESVASNITYKIITLIVLGPIWLGFWWWSAPRMAGTWSDLAAGSVATLMAAALTYVWGYAASMLAFYITRMEGFAELYFGVTLFLSGRFAAIDWLPAPVQWLTWMTPFRWSHAFPVELLMGRLSGGAIAAGFAWQAVWLVIGVIVLRFAWARGIRRYGAVGG